MSLTNYGTEEEDGGVYHMVCREDNLNLVLEMLSWEGLGDIQMKIR